MTWAKCEETNLKPSSTQFENNLQVVFALSVSSRMEEFQLSIRAPTDKEPPEGEFSLKDGSVLYLDKYSIVTN